jgi:chaperone required for assembly of F1-ATPase
MAALPQFPGLKVRSRISRGLAFCAVFALLRRNRDGDWRRQVPPATMRDILDDLLKSRSLDPTEAARKSMRPRRKRFYTAASVSDDNALLLDGKPVKTPARRALATPSRALADTIAAEWNAQGEQIDPGTMPLTRLANAIIDGVADTPDKVIAEIEKYLGSDLVCYRAQEPEGLVARQAQHWDAVLALAREKFGARFVLAQGIVHQSQPREAIEAAAKAIPREPWRLGAAATITTLTGSALIALALAHGAIGPDAAWTAAHVDEDWQMEKWGQDSEALSRRAARRAEFDAAVAVLKAD